MQRDYKENHCWQYDIRLKNLNEDLQELGYTGEINIDDFTFRFISKEDKENCNHIKEFIARHEWLGRMSLYPTHRFIAEYKGHLAGVIIMDKPNSFSKLLGDDTKTMERLISRGACISWSPKNLASKLLMWSIKWMVQNSRYRIFTAYSDVEAKEIGTIYQACNFTYMGQKSGTNKMFKDPKKENGTWFSDRAFRSRSAYKRYAKALSIEWQKDWQVGDRIVWDNMSDDIEKRIRQEAKNFQKTCISRAVPAKHKYCYILGEDKRETKKLKGIFEDRNPKMVNLPYPKERGKV